MDTDKHQEILRGIRKEFFAFRNGIIADKLRRAGDPHPVIMGCLLVDIQGIAQRAIETINDPETLTALAQELWSDMNSRECRLAAPMLYSPQLMTEQEALKWCESVETVEIADNLCHKLLRRLECADGLFRQLITQDHPLAKYTGYRLLLNLLIIGKVQLSAPLRSIVEHESTQTTQGPLALLLKNILEEDC